MRKALSSWLRVWQASSTSRTLLKQMKDKNRLLIQTRTWHRDSHGLFDYESKATKNQAFTIEQNTQIYRVGNICSLNFIQFASTLGKPLANWVTDGYEWLLCQDNQQIEQNEKLWLVINSIRESVHGTQLKQGDVLRFGRLKFKVQKVVIQQPLGKLSEQVKELGVSEMTQIDAKEAPNPEISSLDEMTFVSSPRVDYSQEPQRLIKALPCRFCLSEEYSLQNPLITPCKCTGSVKYVHLNCLQQWIQSKTVTSQKGSVSIYKFVNVSCELCKDSFPSSVRINGEVIELSNIELPKSNHMIMQSIQRNHVGERQIIVLAPTNSEKIKIGRDSTSEIRVTDISVSRNHAAISFVNGSFYVEDFKSKFGTMMQVKKPYSLSKNPIEVQVGRTILRISILKPRGLFACITSCFSKNQTQVSGIAQKIQNESYDSEILQEHGSHVLDIPDQSVVEQEPSQSIVVLTGVQASQEYEEVKENSSQQRGSCQDVQIDRPFWDTSQLFTLARGLNDVRRTQEQEYMEENRVRTRHQDSDCRDLHKIQTADIDSESGNEEEPEPRYEERTGTSENTMPYGRSNEEL